MHKPRIYLYGYKSMKRWRVAREPRKWSSLSPREIQDIQDAHAFIIPLNQERERKEYEQYQASRAEKV